MDLVQFPVVQAVALARFFFYLRGSFWLKYELVSLQIYASIILLQYSYLIFLQNSELSLLSGLWSLLTFHWYRHTPYYYGTYFWFMLSLFFFYFFLTHTEPRLIIWLVPDLDWILINSRFKVYHICWLHQKLVQPCLVCNLLLFLDSIWIQIDSYKLKGQKWSWFLLSSILCRIWFPLTMLATLITNYEVSWDTVMSFIRTLIISVK